VCLCRDQWDLCKNHQPLVLVGGGFGTQVLDDLFLKATEEVLTSPTEAGAFVRNVRGVTLYGDEVKSYKIEKFFGGKPDDVKRIRVWDFSRSSNPGVFITQGSMLINPAIYGKNLTRHVVEMDPCQWIKEDIIEDWDPEVRWKPGSKQSRGYNLLLESCRMVYQFEAIRATLEYLQQKVDNIITACGISNYSDSMFKNEFTYLRHNGIEGAKILIVQRMLATMDVEQHMVARKSDDGEELENERKLAILKFTVERFCEYHVWHMVPEMLESDMRHTIESSLRDVVDGIPPLSDDDVNMKMQRESERESMDHSDRKPFHRDGNDTVPIHFPSIREQSTMSVKQLQQLACNMRPGENLPQENVQEQLMAHMAQVLHGGKPIVTAKILEGKIQFLFGNAQSMAEIVGVGLDFATVSVTRQNVIVVEGITELEWTRLWGEVVLGENLFENPIFMEKVVISPPDREKAQGPYENALSKVAMFFMIRKFLRNLDVGKVYNQVARGVATTTTEENLSDIGQVHAKSDNEPSTGILKFNLWDYLSWFQITRGLGSATGDSSGEGSSHLGGTDTPHEGDKDQGGTGGEGDGGKGDGGEGDGGEGKGRGVKGKEIQQNNQPDVRVIVHTGYEHGRWNRNPVPEQLEGSDIDPTPEQLKESYITPTLEFVFDKAKTTIESDVKVMCCMSSKSVQQNSKRYGWFQYKLQVSFQCLEREAAVLAPSKLLDAEDVKVTDMEQEQTIPSKVDLKLRGGPKGIISGEVGWTKSLAPTLKLVQTAKEMPLQFIKGTRFCVDLSDEGGSTPMLKYNCKFWPEVPENEIPDGSHKDKYKSMFGSVNPHCTANWSLLNESVCRYELKVERHARELVLDAEIPVPWYRRKENPTLTSNEMLQKYSVILYINHNVSIIETLAKFDHHLWKNYPRNELVGLNMHPGTPFSVKAPFNTQ
jgi:hypothetical protein